MIQIIRATANHTAYVSQMIRYLLAELSGGSDRTTEIEEDMCQELLSDKSGYQVYLAIAGSAIVGLISVSESSAICAGGRFGIIHELYVTSEWRSRNVGARLIDTVIEAGRVEGWKRLEVGAPNPTQWGRTVQFYKMCGFEEIGPRLKRML